MTATSIIKQRGGMCFSIHFALFFMLTTTYAADISQEAQQAVFPSDLNPEENLKAVTSLPTHSSLRAYPHHATSGDKPKKELNTVDYPIRDLKPDHQSNTFASSFQWITTNFTTNASAHVGKSSKMPFGSSKNPSMSPSIKSSKPTSIMPSSSQSSIIPSSSPTSQPTGVCTDLPKFSSTGIPMPDKIWTMPPDSVWMNSNFAGKSCDQLELLVPENQPSEREKLCNFLSQGIYSGPCPLEACCFCGGGSHIFQPRCKNLEWNNMKKAGAELNCDFIDALPKRSQDMWCNDFGDETFDMERLTLREACCACGGGDHHISHNFLANTNTERKIKEAIQVKSGTNNAASATILPEGYSAIDINYLDKTGGLKGGIPNLEYLGLGYDIINGNPRGSEDSELDPGFRYRVLMLLQDQNNKTVDKAYTVPLGTAVKYTSTCKYEDSSVEVSSESDLRTSLSREAAIATSKASSTTTGLNLLIVDFSTTIKKQESFKESSVFQQRSETNRKDSLVSFESRAVCSEFEASFIPGYKQVMSPEFKNALDALPFPYDKKNRRDRRDWNDFFHTFGTYHVCYLVLGGKRIHETSMSQQDYTSLVSQSVDVSQTLSFEMGSALGASAGVKVGLAKAAGSLLGSVGGAKGQVFEQVTNVITSGKEDNENLVGLNLNSKSDYSLAQFARSAAQAASAEKIAATRTTNKEKTIGGLPNEDWREWATTVNSKPMPIKYDLCSNMDLMSYEQVNAFIEAFQDLYGIDLSVNIDKPFLDGTVHHGVFTGTGQPLSKHVLNPNDSSKVLMQNTVMGAIGNSTPSYDITTPLDGECQDSQQRPYSYLVIENFGQTPIECIEQCQKKKGTGQVGVGYIVLQPQFPNRCHCKYTRGDVPPDITWLMEGSGQVRPNPNLGPTNSKCFPNLNYDRSTIFLYSDTFKDKTFKPTPFFATPIHGKVSPDVGEKFRVPFFKGSNGQQPSTNFWNDNMFFARTDNQNTNGKLAVTNFGEMKNFYVSQNQVPCYSFVAVNTFEKYGRDFRSAVVSHYGLILNEDCKDKFEVSTDSSGISKTSFSIRFKDNYPPGQEPTVVAFPNWFGQNVIGDPVNVEDINFAIREIASTGFVINHRKNFADSPLGFNFMVIGPAMSTKNVKHGIVTECTESGLQKTYEKHGFIVTNSMDCTPNGGTTGGWVQKVIVARHAGVTIQFATPFDDIPSVVATPFQGNTVDLIETQYATKCVVEDLTKTTVTVKCAVINGDQEDYRPVPFTFAAFGNVAKEE